jgi:hypothetical protein
MYKWGRGGAERRDGRRKPDVDDAVDGRAEEKERGEE